MGTFGDRFMHLYDISPDGRQIILATYVKKDEGFYYTKLKLLNLESDTFSDLLTPSILGLPDVNTFYVGIHWIP